MKQIFWLSILLMPYFYQQTICSRVNSHCEIFVDLVTSVERGSRESVRALHSYQDGGAVHATLPVIMHDCHRNTNEGKT